MKNSVLILGIALALFSNSSNAKNTVSLPYNSSQKNILLDDNTNLKVNTTAKFEKPYLVGDIEMFNPETVIAYNPKTVKETIIEGDKIVENTVSDDVEFMEYEESMREIISQSDLATENSVSNERFPLYIERTVADDINELELIIESNESNEIAPLDFKKINRSSMMNNSFNSKKFIGMN